MKPPFEKNEIAVVIPTYNRAQSIGRTIESVLAADTPGMEIFVVDDGSTDQTAQVLHRYANRINIITLEGRHGANHARNVGAAASHTPILAFLDSDDTFHPSRPSRLIAYYKANPDVDAVLDSFMVKRRGVERDARQPEGPISGQEFAHLLIAHAIPLTNSALSIRREAFDAVGGYDATLYRHQDRDLLLKLARAHRIVLGTGKDLLKIQSPDSMSRQGPDYVAAVAAIVERHPQFRAPQYHDLLRYLAVRGILKMLIAGRFFSAFEEIRALKNCPTLPRSLVDCFVHYRAGKKVRSNARAAAYGRS
ncbi:MAG: glycosyltransferase family 2 protein [Xanthobacteraceae bacterium]|nr:glycosyltransferase family 2 protein [Xanthobacteraceae bacterium]